MKNPIQKIAVTGGTHGNELTGVYLVNKFKANPDLVRRETFETVVMHTNEKAIEKCTRYIEKDLNRTFSLKDLADPEKYSYEELLAKEINAQLGPKGSPHPKMDFIVDLHTTTSNMGMSIIIDNKNALTWQLAAYLKEREPKVKIFTWKGDTGDAAFLHSIAPNGFAIEAGAVPQGVLRADIFLEMEQLVHHILDFFEKYNTQKLEEATGKIETYAFLELLDFPRDTEGNITGMIHPDLQGKDFMALHSGDPLFLTLEGETVRYEKTEENYAVFINEAAYYEKGFALCLCQKKHIEIPKMT